MKPPLATARAASCNWAVRPFVCLSVCLSVAKVQKLDFVGDPPSWMLTPKCKNAIFSKTEQFRAMVYWRSIGSRAWAFQRTNYLTPKIQDGGHPPSWKSTRRQFSAMGGPIWIKFCKLAQNDMSTAVIWSKLKPGVEFHYGGCLGIHRRAACHIAGCCHLANSMSCHPKAMCHIAGCKNSIRHIENRSLVYFILLFF